MDLRNTFDLLLREIATSSLQEAGFTKRRLSFRRHRGFYVEHFVFQASKFNNPEMQCHYYLNAGIEFPLLSSAAMLAFESGNGLVSWLGKKRVSLLYMSPQTVWATRASSLSPAIPDCWEITPETDFGTLKKKISAAIPAASEAMLPWARSLRKRAWGAQVLGIIAYPFIRHKLKKRGRP